MKRGVRNEKQVAFLLPQYIERTFVVQIRLQLHNRTTPILSSPIVNFTSTIHHRRQRPVFVVQHYLLLDGNHGCKGREIDVQIKSKNELWWLWLE